MTVAELIRELEKFDSALEVGGCGHFGELLTLDSVSLYEGHKSVFAKERDKFVFLDIDSPGEEPE